MSDAECPATSLPLGEARTVEDDRIILDLDKSVQAEALAIMRTFDARLTEAEKRIDRVLARLGVE